MSSRRTDRSHAEAPSRGELRKLRICPLLFCSCLLATVRSVRGCHSHCGARARRNVSAAPRGAETAFHANDANRANRRGMAKPRTERTGADRREQVRGMDEALEWRKCAEEAMLRRVARRAARPRRRTVGGVGLTRSRRGQPPQAHVRGFVAVPSPSFSEILIDKMHGDS